MNKYNDALKSFMDTELTLAEDWSLVDPDKVYDVAAQAVNDMGQAGILDPNPNRSVIPVRVFNAICNYTLETGNEAGVGKRLAAMLYKQYGLSLRGHNDIVAKFGTLIKDSSWVYEKGLRIRITLGCAGKPEDYAHRDSCWFTGSDYGYSRDYLAHNNGGAIRIYRGDKLLARIWHAPTTSGDMLLFNPYGAGFENLERFAMFIGGVLNSTKPTLPFKVSTNVRLEREGAESNVYFNRDGFATIGFDAVSTAYLKWSKPRATIYPRYSVCGDCGRSYVWGNGGCSCGGDDSHDSEGD